MPAATPTEPVWQRPHQQGPDGTHHPVQQQRVAPNTSQKGQQTNNTWTPGRWDDNHRGHALGPPRSMHVWASWEELGGVGSRDDVARLLVKGGTC